MVGSRHSMAFEFESLSMKIGNTLSEFVGEITNSETITKLKKILRREK